MFEDLKPHLAELRKRLAISFGVVIAFAFIAFGFNKAIIEFTKSTSYWCCWCRPFYWGNWDIF